MAKADIGATAERLFQSFLAPLVLGGEMNPERPIGGRMALSIESDRPPVDPERFSHVQLARCRRGRELAGVDRFENFSAEEWALAAVLHDLVQATHPALVGLFRKSAPARLVEIAEKTLDRIPPPRSPKEALSRHTLFGRMFEITRTDTEVKWWTGSAKFLGTAPPARLTAWPEFRRVNVIKTPHPLMSLPVVGAEHTYAAAIAKFLSRTPLTDFATCERHAPSFAFNEQNLALLRSRPGRTLIQRALNREEAPGVDAALGRATKALFDHRAWVHLQTVMDLLGERALARAQEELARTADPKPLPIGTAGDEATYARAAGALAARQFIATQGGCFSERERRSLLSVLGARATSDVAKQIEAAFGQ